jgi:hypothetical protein
MTRSGAVDMPQAEVIRLRNPTTARTLTSPTISSKEVFLKLSPAITLKFG